MVCPSFRIIPGLVEDAILTEELSLLLPKRTESSEFVPFFAVVFARTSGGRVDGHTRTETTCGRTTARL